MISGTLALAFAAAFTGASFYVNWVEQPARLKLDDAALLSEWGPSDSRGAATSAWANSTRTRATLQKKRRMCRSRWSV